MTLNVCLKVVLLSYSIERRSNVIFLNLYRCFRAGILQIFRVELVTEIIHVSHLFIICSVKQGSSNRTIWTSLGETSLAKFGFEWETVLLFYRFCGCRIFFLAYVRTYTPSPSPSTQTYVVVHLPPTAYVLNGWSLLVFEIYKTQQLRIKWMYQRFPTLVSLWTVLKEKVNNTSPFI